MGKKTLFKRMPLKQMIAVAAASISLVFLLAFGGQIVEIYRLRSALVIADQGVGELRAEEVALEATLAYVQTDAYVEQVARAELNKIRPGDRRVVIVTREAPPPTSAPAPTPAAPALGSSHLNTWWDLLFGP